MYSFSNQCTALKDAFIWCLMIKIDKKRKVFSISKLKKQELEAVLYARMSVNLIQTAMIHYS